MPLIFLDWQKIHDLYYKATKLEFPYPNEHSVVYDWESPNFFWEDRRKSALNHLNAAKTVFDDNGQELQALGERVKAQGQTEREKERAFLSKIMPGFDFTNISDIELIQKLNEIINGK